MKEGKEAEAFSFSRSWTASRIILHLAVGKIDLLNVTFLVADAEKARRDLLIDLPILRQLDMDSETFLENNSSSLYRTDGTGVGTS